MSDNETISGIFWPPGEEHRAWSGELRLFRHGSGNIVLAAVPSVNTEHDWLYKNHPILHGLSDGRKYLTLEDCRCGERGGVTTPSEIGYSCSSIWFRRAWRGALLTQELLHQIDSVEFHFKGLSPLIGSKIVAPREEPGRIVLEIPEQDACSCEFEEGTIHLHTEYPWEWSDGDLLVTPRTILRYAPVQPKAWHTGLAQIMHHATNFLNFIAREEVHPTSIWLTVNSGTRSMRQRFELLTRPTAGTMLRDKNRILGMLSLLNTGLTTETLLMNWMKTRAAIAISFYNYWLTISGGPEVEQGRLLFSVAALEGIDRARRPELPKPPKKTKPKGDLFRRLLYLFQKTRACSLFEKTPEQAACAIVNARNSIMHGSEKVGKWPDLAEAVWMSQLCQATYEQSLWEVLGVDASSAADVSYQSARNRLSKFTPELPAPEIDPIKTSGELDSPSDR